MPSNAFVALGGLANGLGQSLQHKADQEHVDNQKHQDLINGLVSAGITSGKVSDPEQAFKFLMNGGKKSNKDLPPTISTLIQSVLQHHNTGDGTDTNAGSTAAPPALPALPAQGASSPAGSPTPPADGGSGPADLPNGAGSSAPPVMAPPPARPASSNPMGGFKTTDQLANEEVARRGKDVEATAQTGLDVKIKTARRMFESGAADSLQEAYELVGLRKPRMGTGTRPMNIADHVPAASVPQGALTVSGDPVDPKSAPFFKTVAVHAGWNADGSPNWETRFEPGSAPSAGAGGGQDPAKFRERVTELTAAHGPTSQDPWTPEKIRAEAGKTLSAEAANTAELGGIRTQAAGEAAGIKAGPYDDLPKVLQMADGKADPESQKAFITALEAKPKGKNLAQNIRAATEYKMPASDFTSRQIGGLNRATFVALAREFDPTFDETKYKPRQDMITSWHGDGKTAQTMASAKKIVNHLGELAKASQEMDKITSNATGGIGNELLAGAKRVIGSKQSKEKAQQAVAHYKTAEDVLALELRRFFATAGSGSQQEIADWQKLANPYGTTTDRQTFLNTAAKMMLGQVVPKVEQYRSTIGTTPPGDLWLNNKDRLRLRGMGVDIGDLPPLPENERSAPNPGEEGLPVEIRNLAPGMKATMPDGTIWYRDANGTLRGGTTVAPKAK